MTAGLSDTLRAKGYGEFTPVSVTGEVLRQGSKWFVGRSYGSGFVVANYGDWKTGEQFTWRSSDEAGFKPLSQEELTALDREIREQSIKDAAARDEEQERVRRVCLDMFAGAMHRGVSPYFTKKKLPENKLYGCAIDMESEAAAKWGTQTLVPAYDATGKLWGLQRISPDGKYKIFKEGMRIHGCFAPLSSDPSLFTPGYTGTIFICEGIATAASVYECLAGGTRWEVVSAFNAGNIPPVARALRGRHPEAKIVICADNDQFTQKHGQPWNPGIEYGRTAAYAVGGLLTWPEFGTGHLKDKPTDFNDAHVLYGLATVRNMLANAGSPERGAGAETPPEAPEQPPVPAGEPAGQPPAEEKDKGPHLERKIAAWLLREMDGRLVRQNGSLFAYDGKRWLELDESQVDALKNRMNAACGDKLPSKTVNSMFATFLRYIPAPPKSVNLFVPSPDHANFNNGTLHLKRDLATGKYTTEFRPHAPGDFLTWLVPVDYKPAAERTERNPKLDELLEEAFKDDPDKDGKIKAAQECGGTMLVAAFPQIFIFHGVSGSRKSTLAKVLLKPLQEAGFENVSFADPSEMKNFHAESLIGKLVNVKTDIDDMAPLPRGFIKCFEDRLPFEVNRKGKKVVKSMLPQVHMYCANNLPPNYEKSTAFGRRVTIIGFDRSLTEKREETVKFYEDLIYAAGKQGVINFMLDGLDRVISQGGNFSGLASSDAKVKAWSESYDAVAMFLKACAEGEVTSEGNNKLSLDKEAEIERARLWASYTAWHLTEFSKVSVLGRNKFFDALRQRGFVEKKTETGWIMFGIGVYESPNSII